MAKVKISYISDPCVFTILDNPNLSFIDFCKEILHSKWYISLGTNCKSVAINRDDIRTIEEID